MFLKSDLNLKFDLQILQDIRLDPFMNSLQNMLIQISSELKIKSTNTTRYPLPFPFHEQSAKWLLLKTKLKNLGVCLGMLSFFRLFLLPFGNLMNSIFFT